MNGGSHHRAMNRSSNNNQKNNSNKAEISPKVDPKTDDGDLITEAINGHDKITKTYYVLIEKFKLLVVNIMMTFTIKTPTV